MAKRLKTLVIIVQPEAGLDAGWIEEEVKGLRKAVTEQARRTGLRASGESDG